MKGIIMTDNFLGLPVEGEPYVPREYRTEQLSEAEVDALFRAVIEAPGVQGIAWTQYTPHWNDGEPCVFSVHEPYIALEGARTEEDEGYDFYFDYGWQEDDYEENGRVWLSTYNSEFDRLVGKRRYNWSGGNRSYTDEIVNEALFHPIYNLFNAIGEGKCNHVLMQKFGDSAQITIDVQNGKVIINEYDHD